jgi:hypothetical protein
VSKAEEYRRAAEECERLAKAVSPEVRKQYEAVARQWRNMAAQMEYAETYGVRFSELKLPE